MPYAKVTVAAYAILVILGLLMLGNIGTYGISNNQARIASYGSINQPQIANNVVTNGNFNNGFAGWSGDYGWENPNQSSQGFGFIVNDGHNSPPCLKLENDPYGVNPPDGNAGACWQCWTGVTQGQMVHIVLWAKTDADDSHRYGLRIGWDGWSSITPGQNYVGGAISVINCSVPIVASCPTVAWGTSSWTKIEVYGTINSNVHSWGLWIQAWNGGTPSTGGTIGTGTDFAGAYVDDVFVSIT